MQLQEGVGFGVHPMAWGADEAELPSRYKAPDAASLKRVVLTPTGQLSTNSRWWNGDVHSSEARNASCIEEKENRVWDDHAGSNLDTTAEGDVSAAEDATSENMEGDSSAQRMCNVEPEQGMLTWSEGEQHFWCDTGVNLEDIPDGGIWQQEFRVKLQGAAPSATRRTQRTLKVCRSVAEPPDSVEASTPSRSLSRNPSDPEARAFRAAHNTALQKMPHTAGVEVHVRSHSLALFRFQDRVFAVAAKCPHQGGSLAQGEVGDIEDMVEGWRCYVTCPVHKFLFDLRTGRVLEGSCDKLRTYPVRLRAKDGPAATKVLRVEVGFAQLTDDFFSLGDSESE
mmetsp:Transcript_29994/g.54654  ORF Transcript_29994/g.54654 Transcript_29994/m.54654 type:complete len:339 (-) Transcript_29994:145-1161(-)